MTYVLRIFTGVVLGLLLLGLYVLAVPLVVINPTWNTIQLNAPEYEAMRFSGTDLRNPQQFHPPDPFMRMVACHFDLGVVPMRFFGPRPEGNWSVALFDETGTNLFNFSQLVESSTNRLDVLALTEAQFPYLDLETHDWIQNAVIIQVPIERGFVLLRLFVPTAAHEARVEEQLSEFHCTFVELLEELPEKLPSNVLPPPVPGLPMPAVRPQASSQPR